MSYYLVWTKSSFLCVGERSRNETRTKKGIVDCCCTGMWSHCDIMSVKETLYKYNSQKYSPKRNICQCFHIPNNRTMPHNQTPATSQDGDDYGKTRGGAMSTVMLWGDPNSTHPAASELLKICYFMQSVNRIIN